MGSKIFFEDSGQTVLSSVEISSIFRDFALFNGTLRASIEFKNLTVILIQCDEILRDSS